jgi:hypothetical protein
LWLLNPPNAKDHREKFACRYQGSAKAPATARFLAAAIASTTQARLRI